MGGVFSDVRGNWFRALYEYIKFEAAEDKDKQDDLQRPRRKLDHPRSL